MKKLVFESAEVSKRKNKFTLTFKNNNETIKKFYEFNESLDVDESTLNTICFHLGLMYLIDLEQIFFRFVVS